MEECGFRCDFIVANDFTPHAKGIRFALNVIGNKANLVCNTAATMNVTPDEVMFIGDDSRDHQAMTIVKYPVVSFLAEERMRAHLQEKCAAVSFANEEEFSVYLQAHT